jgi:hypothetical protein
MILMEISVEFLPIEVAKNWSGKRDSNSRPRPWQGRALPAELFPRFKVLITLEYRLQS